MIISTIKNPYYCQNNNELAELIKLEMNQYLTKDDLTVKKKVKVKKGAGTGFAAGAAIGAAAGSFIPIIGTGIGALIGGFIGASAAEEEVTEEQEFPSRTQQILVKVMENPKDISSYKNELEEELSYNKRFLSDLINLHVTHGSNQNMGISIADSYIKVFNTGYQYFPDKMKDPLAEMTYIKALCLFNKNNISNTGVILDLLENVITLAPDKKNAANAMQIAVLTMAFCQYVNKKDYSKASEYLDQLLNMKRVLSSIKWTDRTLPEIEEELLIAMALYYNNKGDTDKALNHAYLACLKTTDIKRASSVLYDCYLKIYRESHNKIYEDINVLIGKLGADSVKKDEILRIYNGILILIANTKQYSLVFKYLNDFKFKLSENMQLLRVKVSKELMINAYDKGNVDEAIAYCDVIFNNKSLSDDGSLVILLYCYLDKGIFDKADIIYHYLSKKLGQDIRLEVAKAIIMLQKGEKTNECYNICTKVYKEFDDKKVKYLGKIFELFKDRMLNAEAGQKMLLHCFKYLNSTEVADAVVKVVLSVKSPLDPNMLSAIEKAYTLIKSRVILERLADEYALKEAPDNEQFKLMAVCFNITPDKYNILVKICNYMLQRDTPELDEIQYFTPAIKFYDKLSENSVRPFYEYSTYLGLIYKKYGYFDKAEFYLGRALINNGNYKLAGHELIDVYLINGLYEKAFELIEYFIKSDKQNDKLWCFKGKYFYYTGDLLNAEKCYEKALQINSYQLEAREGIAQLGSITAERQKAIAQYNNILQINKDDTNAHVNIGVLFLQSGNDKDAESHFRAAVLLNPELLEAYIYLVQIYIKREDIDKAKECMDRLMHLSKNDDNIERNIEFTNAIIHQQSGDIKKAKRSYSYLLKKYGDDYRVYNNISCIDFEYDKMDGYLESLDRALELDKGNKVIEGNRELLSLKNKNYFDYIKWFEVSDTNIDKFKLFAATAYAEGGYIEKALRTINDVNDRLLVKSDLKSYDFLKAVLLAKSRLATPESINAVAKKYSIEDKSEAVKYLQMLANEVSYDTNKNAKAAYKNYETFYNNDIYRDEIYYRLAKRLSFASSKKFEELPADLKMKTKITNIEEAEKIPAFDLLNIPIKPMLEQSISSYGEWEISGNRMEGGMAYVTRVYNRKKNVYGALKELKPKLINNKTTRDNFKNEAYFLADSLNHKNIVKVFADTIDPHKCSYVMEYLYGGSLRKLMNTRQLNINEAALIIISILEALKFFHNLGEKYIHLDVTPENVMFTDKGDVKLTDFGISYFKASTDIDYTDVEDNTSLAGKLPYMATEILTGGVKTQKADQYSVGVMAYELLGGELPYEPEDKEEAAELAWTYCAINGAEKQLFELNPKVPKELSEVVHKMFSFEPTDRYPSVSEALSRLKKIFVDIDYKLKDIDIYDNSDAAATTEDNSEMNDLGGQYSFGNWKPAGYRKTGATCYVTKVYNENLGIYGALKILKPEYITNSTVRGSFMSEAMFLANTNKNGLIKVYKTSIDKERCCYVMEWIDGAVLNESILSSQEILVAFQGVSQVLLDFHFLNPKYVHLDISPQNIMISNSGQAFLLDFGSGYYGQRNTGLNGRKGKYPYIAPEIYKYNNVTQKADVYSLGAVFYKLITGVYPVAPKEENAPQHIWANEVINKKIVDIRELKPDVNSILADTIMKMLNKDFNKRLNMKDVVTALKTFKELNIK